METKKAWVLVLGAGGAEWKAQGRGSLLRQATLKMTYVNAGCFELAVRAAGCSWSQTIPRTVYGWCAGVWALGKGRGDG